MPFFIIMLEVLTKDSFERFINQPFAMVDFWASWCGPCRALMPILEKISSERGIKIGKMSVEEDETQEFAQRYRVQSIPSLLFFKEGVLIDTNVGLISEEDLLEKIKRYAEQ